MNRRQTGRKYEEAVARALEARGYEVIGRNYRCRTGEIDLIALDGRDLVFIEVKYRADASKGWPQEAVDWHKQQVICRVADHFLMSHPQYRDCQIRFDVAAVLGTKWKLYRHAFEYQRGKRWN